MTHFVQLLGLPYLACLMMIAILGYLGIHVLKREIIFIDIALAQVVAVGAIAAHLFTGAHRDSMLGYTCAFGFALIAAAFYSVARRRIVQIPLEAVIGVSYGIAAAAALFLVGIAPGGHVHIQQMLSGSILWVTWKDMLWCAVVFSAAGFGFYLFRKPFGKISDDYEGAVEEGVHVIWWDFLFYSLLGLVITLSVGIGGVVVVFCFLIIPATISALFSSSWGVRLAIAWAMGAAASMMGLLFADILDFSVGPAVALFLGVALVLSALSRILRAGLAATAIGLVVLVYAILLFVGYPQKLSSLSDGAVSGLTGPGGETCCLPVSEPAPEPDAPESAIPEEELANVEDVQEIERRFKKAADADVASAIVRHALELDPQTGARLAMEFLKGDPPFFFRQLVVEMLETAMGEPAGFDIGEPFASSRNRKAAAKVAARYGIEISASEQ